MSRIILDKTVTPELMEEFGPGKRVRIRNLEHNNLERIGHVARGEIMRKAIPPDTTQHGDCGEDHGTMWRVQFDEEYGGNEWSICEHNMELI